MEKTVPKKSNGYYLDFSSFVEFTDFVNQVVKDHSLCHIIQAFLNNQHVVKHKSKKEPEKMTKLINAINFF
jgi:hypothetical protein